MRLGLIVVLCALLLSPATRAETVQQATPIERPAPDYPDSAGHVEGFVKMRFTIDAAGHVKDAVPFESQPQGVFDSAAVAALSHWSYHPRLVDGKPADQPGNAIMLRFKPDLDQPPIWLNPSTPYYPRQAYNAKVEGMVTVGYDIDEQGMVDKVHVVSSTLPGVFDQEAIKDVEDRVFRPMIVDGVPTRASELTTAVEFKYNDAKIAPKLIYYERPEYPASAENAQLSGYCALAYTVGADGSVVDPKIVASFPAGVFEKTTLDIIKKWRYEPAQTRDGPVAANVNYTFKYLISGTKTQYLKLGQWIKLDYTLQSNGRPKDITVISQSEPDLPVDKAVHQLKEMKFSPVIENGQPVEKLHQVVTIK